MFFRSVPLALRLSAPCKTKTPASNRGPHRAAARTNLGADRTASPALKTLTHFPSSPLLSSPLPLLSPATSLLASISRSARPQAPRFAAGGSDAAGFERGIRLTRIRLGVLLLLFFFSDFFWNFFGGCGMA